MKIVSENEVTTHKNVVLVNKYYVVVTHVQNRIRLLQQGQTFTFGWVITMVNVHNVAMVTMVMLYMYPFQCVDPVLLIHKST